MSRCIYCGNDCRKTWIYVIGEADCPPSVKVGYAGNAPKRLAQLRKQTGRCLTILAKRDVACEFKAMDVEDLAHRLLADCWTGRGEWFHCDVSTALTAIDASIKRLGERGRRP